MYKLVDDIKLSQVTSENSAQSGFVQPLSNFEQPLSNNNHLANISSDELEMLCLASDALASFYYQMPQGTLHTHGEHAVCEPLVYSGLLNRLRTSPSKLKRIDDAESDLLVPANYQLLVMLLTGQDGKALGLLGTVFNKFTVRKRRVKNNTAQVAFRVDSHKRRLLSLLMAKFEKELRIRQQQYALQAIHSQHLQISALNQDLICIKDSAHKLVYANPAYLNTFPKSAQKNVLGRNHFEFYPPEISAQITDSDITALTSGYFSGNQKLVMANKQEKILQINKKVFFGIDGKKYLMSVSRDVTEKEVLINDLTRSNADLDNFAYVASHDLKSPINVIKRLVTWVKEDCDHVLPNESKEDLTIVLSRVERMEKLLRDLLNYSRIGKDYKESVSINLHEFVVELLSLIDLPMGFAMNCDDIDITVPEVPFNVVMLNLVSNAIKHNDSGNAKIEIKAKRNDKGCTISVLDNGPGIAEKNRERIFELFETLKPKDEIEGSGMGLSVVKRIVELYGGSIKVEANVPRGTKFIVYWPISNLARSVLDNLKKQSVD